MTDLGVRLLATLLFAPALFASDVPVLRTEGSQWVIITHPRLEASWKIQFPEAIGTSDAFYLVWYPISAEWKTQANGEIRYSWKASKQWIKNARKKVDRRGFLIKLGVGLTARMLPSRDRIDLSIELENLTSEPLRQAWSDSSTTMPPKPSSERLMGLFACPIPTGPNGSEQCTPLIRCGIKHGGCALGNTSGAGVTRGPRRRWLPRRHRTEVVRSALDTSTPSG